VSKDNIGWDIECGKTKYEIKARKNKNTGVILTANEYNAAGKSGRDYILWVFTAHRLSKKTIPQEFLHPTQTLKWKKHPIVEWRLRTAL